MARRTRFCFPRGSGQRGENTITPGDHIRLRNALLHDPQSVLRFFEMNNIAYLSELKSWEALKKAYPNDIACVVAIAALFGISEQPRKQGE